MSALADLKALRGWRLACVVLPVVAALIAIGVALPKSSEPAGGVCNLGVEIARESMDDVSDDSGGTTGAPLAIQDLVSVLERVDFDALADEAPPDVDDDIALVRPFVDDLIAATDAGTPIPPPTADHLAAFKTITTWYSETCG